MENAVSTRINYRLENEAHRTYFRLELAQTNPLCPAWRRRDVSSQGGGGEGAGLLPNLSCHRGAGGEALRSAAPSRALRPVPGAGLAQRKQGTAAIEPQQRLREVQCHGKCIVCSSKGNSFIMRGCVCVLCYLFIYLFG